MLRFIRMIGVILLIVGLSSCAPFHHRIGGLGDRSSEAIDLTVMIADRDINEILANENVVIEKLQQFVSAGDDDGDKSGQRSSYDEEATLADLLSELEAAGEAEGLAIQQGIGGGDADAFIRAVRLKVGKDGIFDANNTVLVRPRGITHHYAYNDKHKSGYIENEVIYDFVVNGTTVDVLRYYWTIGVRPGTYEVHHHSGDDKDPYPNVPMTFSDAMLDDIKARHLRHKLYARGKGIVVLGVHKNGKLLPLSDRLYKSRDDSCIDWMFKNYPPAKHLPTVIQRCLGRCDHPALMNTGT